MKIYIDGKFLEKEDAKISVFDHGLLYGDGVFEGIRAYNGRVFMLEEHIDRLLDSCKGILLQPSWTKRELMDLVVETVRVNKLRDSYIRLLVTRGVGDLGLDMRKCRKPSLIIIADKIELYSEEFYQKGLTLVTSSIRQTSPDALNPNIKSLNYLNNILVRQEATRQGAGEALVLNRQGYVTEGSGDNVFILRNGEWITPPHWIGLLPGITRQVAMQLIRDVLKMPCREDLFSLFDVYRAQESFVCGTGAEILPAVSLDTRPIGDGKPGPNTKKLIAAFREYANSHGTPIYDEVKTAA